MSLMAYLSLYLSSPRLAGEAMLVLGRLDTVGWLHTMRSPSQRMTYLSFSFFLSVPTFNFPSKTISLQLATMSFPSQPVMLCWSCPSLCRDCWRDCRPGPYLWNTSLCFLPGFPPRMLPTRCVDSLAEESLL